MSRLQRIIETTREAVAHRSRALPESELRSTIDPERPQRHFEESLAAPGMALIAEHKRRSPSAGAIREDLSLEQVVTAYERGGATGLSVLTEEANFGGSLDDLREARSLTDLPILRKDFVVGSYQLIEAAAAGADAILLIVAALEKPLIADLLAEAEALALDALVEVHDEAELAVALDVGASLIGINNRDLRDFTVDLKMTFDLLPDIPAGTTVVSESGISSRAQIEELERVGVDAVLVGEALMRSQDPGAAASVLLDRT
jgi:indole-3-glycerol phosphate synthase